MIHLVNNFCEFIMFEVIETSWNELSRALSTVTSLDKVIEAHDAYLSRILDRALLTPEHELLNTQITLLLQCILKFCQMEEVLISDSMAAISSKRATKLSHKGSNQSILSASSRGAKVSRGDEVDGIPSYVKEELMKSIREYKFQYQKVIQHLNKLSEGSNDYVQYLTFRLGFNDFQSKANSI
jgi:hypothetical protein